MYEKKSVTSEVAHWCTQCDKKGQILTQPLDPSLRLTSNHDKRGNFSAVAKSGTGRGSGDACLVTWDAVTRDKGRMGTWDQGRGEAENGDTGSEGRRVI